MKLKERSDTKNLTEGSIWRVMVLFAVPLILSNGLQQLYNAVDTMVVGRFTGDEALAAMGAVSPVYELLVGFALGVGNGMAIVAARYFGRGDSSNLKKSVVCSLYTGAFLSIGLLLFSVFGMETLLRLLDTPEELMGDALEYIGFMTQYAGIMIAYNLCAAMMRAVGNSLVPLLFLALSCGINIVLDLLLVPGMGIQGVALATVISQGISVVLCLVYIFVRCRILIPGLRHFRPDLKLYLDVNGQGFSMGLMSCIVSVGTVILQYSVNGFETYVIAGHTAARRLSYFCMVAQISWGLALSTFVSQNVGAGKGQRVRDGVRFANKVTIVWGFFIIALNYLAAPQLIGLISGSENAGIIGIGTRYMRFNVLFYPVLGILFNLRNGLQGLGRKLIPLVASIMECAGKIIFVVLINPVMGYDGVIICEPVIWIFMTAQLLFAFYGDSYMTGRPRRSLKKAPQ